MLSCIWVNAPFFLFCVSMGHKCSLFKISLSFIICFGALLCSVFCYTALVSVKHAAILTVWTLTELQWIRKYDIIPQQLWITLQIHIHIYLYLTVKSVANIWFVAGTYDSYMSLVHLVKMCFYNICYFDYYIFKSGAIFDGFSSLMTRVKEKCIKPLQLSKAVFFFFFFFFFLFF